MSRLTAVIDRFPWLKSAREVALFAHRRGREVRLQQVASSLTFTTLLSIVPLFAVALALFSVFPLFEEFREAFQSLVVPLMAGYDALLVPATMRLLGHWNWWMPAWLERRIANRLPASDAELEASIR